MPKFKVTDPQSGQSLFLTGDSAPSEGELNQVFAAQAAPAAQPIQQVNGLGAVAQSPVGPVPITAIGQMPPQPPGGPFPMAQPAMPFGPMNPVVGEKPIAIDDPEGESMFGGGDWSRFAPMFKNPALSTLVTGPAQGALGFAQGLTTPEMGLETLGASTIARPLVMGKWFVDMLRSLPEQYSGFKDAAMNIAMKQVATGEPVTGEDYAALGKTGFGLLTTPAMMLGLGKGIKADVVPPKPAGPTPTMPEGEGPQSTFRQTVDSWRDSLSGEQQLAFLRLPREVQWEMANGPKPGVMGFGFQKLVEAAKKRAGPTTPTTEGPKPTVPVTPPPTPKPEQPKADVGLADINAGVKAGWLPPEDAEDARAKRAEKDSMTPVEEQEHRDLFNEWKRSSDFDERAVPGLNTMTPTQQLQLLRDWKKDYKEPPTPVPETQPSLPPPSGPEIIPPDPADAIKARQATAERQAVVDEQHGRRGDVETEKELLHDINNAATIGMNLPKDVSTEYRKKLNKSYLDYQQQKNLQQARDEVAATRKEIVGAANKVTAVEPVVAPSGEPRPPAGGEVGMTEAEMDQALKDEGMNLARPTMEADRLFDQPEKLRLGVDSSGRYDSKTLVGRLANVLHPSEYAILKDAGIETAFPSKVAPEAVKAWVKEHGPRVEVRTKGGLGEKESAAKAEAQHKLETLGYEFAAEDVTSPEGVTTSISHWAEKPGEHQELFRTLQRTTAGIRGASQDLPHWSSISPKPESEMKGYVEIAVVKGGLESREAQGKYKATIIEKFPSSHSFPPNTVGFARGYMEGDTFHVVEVQSDWAKTARENKERVAGGTPRDVEVARAGLAKIDDPLLPHYERLALKSAIDHAIQQGAKRIAVSDAETAMMTEGHDRVVNRIEVAEFPFSDTGKMEADAYAKQKDGRVVGIKFEAGKGKMYKVTEQGGISQEQGMRLHYDRTLPKTLEELTGSKGERVSFGEHKGAFEQGESHWEEARRNPPHVPRKDLIFRNPDGSPKTDVSALSYPLDKLKARGEFEPTLFGRDKMKEGVTTDTQAPKTFDDYKHDPGLTQERQEELKVLDLQDGRDAYWSVERIAKFPNELGHEEAALAQFLLDNFEGALRSTDVFSASGTLRTGQKAGRPAYEQGREAGKPVSRIMMALDNPRAHNQSIASTLLHEAAHAATVWALNNPVTETQLKAVRLLDSLREKIIATLPEDARRFYHEDYLPYVKNEAQKRQTSYSSELLDKGREKGVEPNDWVDKFYALQDNKEFVANYFDNADYREWLNEQRPLLAAKNVFQQVWQAVKDLLGVTPGSAAEKMLDALNAVGQEVKGSGWDFYGKGFKRGMDSYTTDLAAPSVPSPAVPAAVLHDTTFNERIRRRVASAVGYTTPKHAAASEPLANALSRYGASRISAPLVARYMATDVLGKHYKDGAFDRILGDVIVEDQLRGVKKGFVDAAAKATDPAEKAEFTRMAGNVVSLVGRAGHALKTEVQFQRMLGNADIKESIERHKLTIQPLAEKAHEKLGGVLAKGGEATDAFANLIAINSPDDIEAARSMVYGSRKGDITNPLKRGSAFSKHRTGTAADYERSYRAIAERMIRGNYEQVALREYYDHLVATKNGLISEPGIVPPKTPKGVQYTKTKIDLRKWQNKDLWINPDLFNEYRQAALTDVTPPKGALGVVLDAATDLQIIGLTDAWWHTVNMGAAIATSPGSRSIWLDVLRRQPGVNVIDAAVRIGHQFVRLIADHPDVQRELAQISEVGAMRGEPYRHGAAARLIEKIPGVGEESVAKNPLKWTAAFIKTVDKAGRLALNDMFDNLVKQKLVTDNALDRREFINHMGQYNQRLMGYYMSKAREFGISSFVVAGRNFNRLAMQKLLMSPGVRAANVGAWNKMHLVEALTWASSMIAIPVGVNYALTGKWMGRPGTPYGSIDTGKDDEAGRPILIDPLQSMLLRRGLRISGAQAAFRGYDENIGLKQTGQEMLRDVFAGIIHPWTGPAIRTGKIAVSGYDTSGYLVSKNPDDVFENMKAALYNSNPMVSAYLRGSEQKTGGGKELGRSLLSSTGVEKKGRLPTWENRFEKAAGKRPEEMTVGERSHVQKGLDKEKALHPNLNDPAREEAARRALFRGFARTDGLKSEIAPSNRAFLERYNLRLSGFADELTKNKEKLPLVHDEMDRLKENIVKQYDFRIQQLSTNEAVTKWAKDGRLQEKLNDRLTLARGKARAELMQSINRGALQPSSVLP